MSAAHRAAAYPMEPSGFFYAVTPSADALPTPPKAIRVDGAGTLVVTPLYGGSDVTFTLAAGAEIAIRVSHIKAASTATGIVALC